MNNTRKVKCNGLQWTVSVCMLALMMGCSRSAPAEATPTASHESGQESMESTAGAEAQQSQAAVNKGANPDVPQQAQDKSSDPSFLDSNTRPAYDACIKQSGGETWAIQQCGDQELSWQDGRLNRLYKQALSQLQAAERDHLRTEQRAWLKDTDSNCNFDPAANGQGQMLDAQSCRLNRTTNRADQLDRLVRK